MTKHKHTPGPWAVDEFRHEGAINRMEPFRHIGMVSNFLHDHSSRKENEANAKLIAAAPELLAALEALTAHWDDLKSGDSLSVDAARAAIAKATA